MEESSRHHYLPEFYLKGFTNKDGEFMIYLIQKGEFKKNGKFFSVRSHFFKHKDNTIVVEGIENNFIEESYARMETKVAKVFQKIMAKDSNYDLDDQDIPLLQYFAAELFWRLPSNRELVDVISKNFTLRELGMLVKDAATGELVEDAAFEEYVRNNPIYTKMLRCILPVNTYTRIFECTSPVTIYTFPPGLPAICSDNPLILRHPEKFDIYRDDFILPLSANKVLIRIKKLKPQFWSTVKAEVDMLLLCQAKEYVCCTDKLYPILLKFNFLKKYHTVENLRKIIFEGIDADYPLVKESELLMR